MAPVQYFVYSDVSMQYEVAKQTFETPSRIRLTHAGVSNEWIGPKFP